MLDTPGQRRLRIGIPPGLIEIGDEVRLGLYGPGCREGE
jgi:hypothetical protein